MRRLCLSIGIVAMTSTSAVVAQESLCNPCIDPPINSQLHLELAPLRTRSDVLRDPVPVITADQLRQMAPEEAVRRLLIVLDAQGETEMAEQLRNTPPEDAIRDLLKSWDAEDNRETTLEATDAVEADDPDAARE